MKESFRFAGDLFPELTRLQQHLEQVFQAAGPTSIRPFARGGFPAVNVGSSPDSVEVLAFAPGVDPKALQITVDKGLLVIAGERSSDVANPGTKDIVCAHVKRVTTCAWVSQFSNRSVDDDRDAWVVLFLGGVGGLDDSTPS